MFARRSASSIRPVEPESDTFYAACEGELQGLHLKFVRRLPKIRHGQRRPTPPRPPSL
ncbi:protein of unknown function [Paraburkholderia dioscoreae]|uniref:Uncharacterized protein n=1 Tax=Paraburkholderia dioscoreae TaxID=2604047 RepID=A0A5Q4Z1T2_9BURK|nr:protein of unknown function [Paraburkholderia dioscoreae]